jgi:hypothetical protein
MKLIVVLLALVSTHVSALEVGECRGDVGSKRYITKDFSVNYPKTVSFSCEYECRSETGIDKVRGVTTVTYGRANNFPQANQALDARVPVCQGVQLKEVSWGWDYAKTNSFYAFDTKIKEVKEWAANSLSKEGPLEQKKLTELKKSLMKSGPAFMMAGGIDPRFEYMKQAGIVLTEIAGELPQSTDKLDRYIDCIARDHGTVTHPALSAKYLIYSMLKVSAAWKIPALD